MNHAFMMAVLASCNLGDDTIKRINICYTDIVSRLIVNGVKAEAIAVQASVRQ